MLFQIQRNKHGKFSIINLVTQHVLAKNTTKTKAESQVKLLHMIDALRYKKKNN